MKTYPVFN